MISSIPDSQTCPMRRIGAVASRSRRSAFTLIELLVVIGIILVLMALLLPAINGAWKTAVRTRMAADLQTISTALEAYRSDFDQYPQVYTQRFGNVTNAFGNAAGTSPSEQGGGAYWLCRALVGPGDKSVDGAGSNPINSSDSDAAPLGFREKGSYNAGSKSYSGGKIWGPYLPPDTIKMGDPTGANNTNNFVLLDRYRHPILYYPAKKGVEIHAAGGYLGPNGMFNPADNDPTPGTSGSSDSVTGVLTANMFKFLMGDTNMNGQIDPGETPAYQGNYILWSAGPDEKLGALNTTTPFGQKNPCDDVANFPRSTY